MARGLGSRSAAATLLRVKVDSRGRAYPSCRRPEAGGLRGCTRLCVPGLAQAEHGLGQPAPNPTPGVSRQVQRPWSPRWPAGSSCAEGAKPGQNSVEEAAKATEAGRSRPPSLRPQIPSL